MKRLHRIKCRCHRSTHANTVHTPALYGQISDYYSFFFNVAAGAYLRFQWAQGSKKDPRQYQYQ